MGNSSQGYVTYSPAIWDHTVLLAAIRAPL